MTREKKRNCRWLLNGAGVACTLTVSVIVLFLGVPPLMSDRHTAEFQAIDPEGWTPGSVMELCPPDSIQEAINAGRTFICVRHDASAPDVMNLVLNSVLKDGSERLDTVRVPLRDSYGHPTGRSGYVMSETNAALDINGNADDCRLIEMYPADTLTGIHAVGIMLNHSKTNEGK